jgi:imidazolonepropionase-like amidohydrolase
MRNWKRAKNFTARRSTTAWMALAILTLFVLTPGTTAAEILAVKGDLIHTMAGEAIENGVVIMEDGRITKVGAASKVRIPEDARVLEAAVVTPGLIDAHSVVGLSGFLNQRQDQDQMERSAAIQPELRAVDAYNGLDPLVAWVRSFGITTLHTGHAPGPLVSGQTMIVKTDGKLDSTGSAAMVAATLGEQAVRFAGEDKSPGTRAKAVAMLRSELIKAASSRDNMATADDDKTPDRDLRLEALVQVLDGEMPLLITADRQMDIMAALRLAEEFGFRLVLDSAAEVYLALDAIDAAGVPVILHPTMARPSRERENASMETAATLAKAGIPMALQSSYEAYVPKTRVVLFEAAVAHAYGLPYQNALASITLDAARLLGIDARVGSLEVGKDADLALYDGDPFEYTSHCVGVIIDGEVVSEEIR